MRAHRLGGNNSSETRVLSQGNYGEALASDVCSPATRPGTSGVVSMNMLMARACLQDLLEFQRHPRCST